MQLVLIVQKFKCLATSNQITHQKKRNTSGDKRKMSKKQSDALEFTRGDIMGVDRSHTSAHPLQSQGVSNANSFAAHKSSKHDKTNASHNPGGKLDWLDAPVGNQIRKTSKGKGGKEFENDMLEIKRQATIAKARKSVFVPRKVMNKAHTIEMSDTNIKVNSDDEDENNKMGLSRSGEDRLDLLQYNRDRKQQLYDFDFTMD